MRLVALLHRWTGGLVGLLLAIIGLSGTVLIWEESWIGVAGANDPLRADAAAMGDAVSAALAVDPALSRITFADSRLGLHQAIYADGGAYLTQAGEVAERWDILWARPELWLFDLHHYLLMGKSGEYVTGALGLLLLGFAITGLVLWWRTRRKFALRLWPERMTRAAIVRHHRNLGAVASPLLILSALTGVLMVFPSLSASLLSPWSDPARAAPAEPAGFAAVGPRTDWRAVMTEAQAAFPGALPRRLMLPAEPGAPLTLRLRQAFEWTPNGRTYVYLDPATARVVRVDDPAARDTASAITEKFYPVHAGKVGGLLWRLALTFSGLTLVLLGTLATWSFWFGRMTRRRMRTPERAAIAGAAK
jgi:uncharacterized iron-regulated membrane protein